jgi:O-antigen/teichoic acid export membrane protein
MPQEGARAPPTAEPHAGIGRVASNTALYVFALTAPRAVRLVALPLLVHAVAPGVYGSFASLWSLVGFGYGICDLGLGSAAIRLAPEATEAHERRSIFATMLLARAAVGLTVAAVAIAAAAPLARLATGNAADAPMLAIMLLGLPFAALVDGYTSELRARDAHTTVALVTVVRTLVLNGVTLFLVIGLGLGLAGMSWSRTITELVLFALASTLCWRFVRGRFDGDALRKLWTFGWPIGALTLLTGVRGLDRPLIRALSSVDHVAAYDFAMRLVGPIALPTLALGLVLQPLVYRHANSARTPALIDLFVRGYIAVFAIVALLISLLAPEIVGLLAPESYRMAVQAVPGLLFFQFVDGLTRAAGIGAELVKRTRVWATATLVSVGAGLALVPLLVPPLQVCGAALALFFGSATGTVVTYVLALRVSGLVLPVARGVGIAIVAALVATVAVSEAWPLTARLLVLVTLGTAAWIVSGVRVGAFKELLLAPPARAR